MKIGIFTDSHFSSAEVTCGNRYNSRSLEKIRRADETAPAGIAKTLPIVEVR